MKRVQIAYRMCKKRMPNRPPDEIDYGLGFRAALGWIAQKFGRKVPYVDIQAKIKEELQ